VKDNRLLPAGFGKRGAPPAVAVRGTAETDEDFDQGSDRVRYVVNTTGVDGPLTIEAELLFQPTSFRWARDLSEYDALETRRYGAYYNGLVANASMLMARASARVN
jgi:hypothetical protein